jgi:hypothetical protein
MKHVIRPFKQAGIGWTFIDISYTNGKLSLTGVEGPKSNGDCVGSAGQIIMSKWAPSEYTPGYDAQVIVKLREVWDAWHLNDLKAGSPAQEAHLKAHPVTATYPESHYEKVRDSLAAAGLHPDPGYLLNGKPYAYGSAWLAVPVPQDVVDWLFSLPTTGAETYPARWAR